MWEPEDPLSPKYKQTLGHLYKEDLGVVVPSKVSKPMISYGLFSYTKISEPIMEKIQSHFANTFINFCDRVNTLTLKQFIGDICVIYVVTEL